MSPSINTRENREFASELKFLVEPGVAEEIRRWARNTLSPDPYAGGSAGDNYRVTSLYFDSPELDVFYRKGSFGRAKYRIRRYSESEIVFLERKLKTKGLVTKRRSIVPLRELARLEEDRSSAWSGHWFRRRLGIRQMHPVCQISYLRTARVAVTSNGPVRLTLDENLRAHLLEAPGFSDEPGSLLSDNFVIVEMKFLFSLPSVFKSIVQEFHLDARPFSKYRFAVHKLGLVHTQDFDELEEQSQPASSLCLTS